MTNYDIQSLVDSLLPHGCAAVAVQGPVESAQQELVSSEVAAAEEFSPARAAEFAEGRWCARQALSKLTPKSATAVANTGIPRRADGVVGVRGAPVWPAGVVGAISHSAHWRIAAVAAAEDISGLGLDIEKRQPFSAEIASMVLSQAERRDCSDVAQLAKFSAKESLFKLWAPIMQRWLGFEDAEVMLNRGCRHDGAVPTGTVEFHLAADKSQALIQESGMYDLSQLQGRYLITEDFVLTVAWITRSPAEPQKRTSRDRQIL